MLLTNILLPGTLSGDVVEQWTSSLLYREAAQQAAAGEQWCCSPRRRRTSAAWTSSRCTRSTRALQECSHLISTGKSQEEERCSACTQIFWRIQPPSDRMQKVLRSLPTCGEDHGKTNHSFHWLLEHREASEGILIMLMSNQWHCHDDSQSDLMDKEWWIIDNRNSDLKATLIDNEWWGTYMVIPRVITM